MGTVILLFICIAKLSQGVNAKSQYGSAKSQTGKANSHSASAILHKELAKSHWAIAISLVACTRTLTGSFGYSG